LTDVKGSQTGRLVVVVGSLALVPGTEIEWVALDLAASPQEVAAVEKAFARVGHAVAPEADIVSRSTATDLLPWIVAVELLIPISAFMRGLASEAAEDSYPAIKRWVTELFTARRSSSAKYGSIRVSDPDGLYLEIESGIPDEALDALAEIDWIELGGGGYIAWDFKNGEWVAPFKRT
jgi:hypothetical protein